MVEAALHWFEFPISIQTMRVGPLRFHSPAARLFTFSLSSYLSRSHSSFRHPPNFTQLYAVNCAPTAMSLEKSKLIVQKRSSYRLCNVSGHKTDLLEIIAEDPKWHIFFVPGNPGVISFYIDFVDNLFETLGGTASITAIGHISQTEKDWEQGKLFSLEDQINHKVDFIDHELQNIEVPIVLIGHSIGSYMSLEILRRCPEKVAYCVGLYPFLAVNKASPAQSNIKRIVMSPLLSALVASATGFLGMLPKRVSQLLVTNSIGKSWTSTAVEALVTHLLEYHTMRNVLFLAMTEFKKLSETPDWAFMRENESQLAFLFGTDDHWGPLQMLDEISRNVPGADLAVEREGHTHAFSCTRAGSLWAAQHVASLIKNRETN